MTPTPWTEDVEEVVHGSLDPARVAGGKCICPICVRVKAFAARVERETWNRAISIARTFYGPPLDEHSQRIAEALDRAARAPERDDTQAIVDAARALVARLNATDSLTDDSALAAYQALRQAVEALDATP